MIPKGDESGRSSKKCMPGRYFVSVSDGNVQIAPIPIITHQPTTARIQALCSAVHSLWAGFLILEGRFCRILLRLPYLKTLLTNRLHTDHGTLNESTLAVIVDGLLECSWEPTTTHAPAHIPQRYFEIRSTLGYVPLSYISYRPTCFPSKDLSSL